MRLRAIVALAAATLAAMFLSPAAQAAPAERVAQYPPATCALLSVSSTNPLVGEAITVSGVNFNPNASVRLALHMTASGKVYDLKTVTTDNTGSFTTTVKLPDGVSGRGQIVAATGAPDIPGCPPDPFVTIHIQGHGVAGSSAGPTGPGGTSFTGVDVLLIVLAALVLLGIGYALTRAGKSKHGGTGHPLIDS